MDDSDTPTTDAATDRPGDHVVDEAPPPTDGDSDATTPIDRSGPRRDVALAIDINGTRMAVGLATRKAELIDRDQVVVDHDIDGERLFTSLTECIDRVRARASERHGAHIVVCGVGCTGPADRA